MSKSCTTTAQTFERGLHLLEYLITYKRASVTGVAKLLGIQKSASYRLLNTLRVLDYVKQDEHSQYIFTNRLNRLLAGLPAGIKIENLVSKQLNELAHISQQTSNLGYFDGREIVYVAQKILTMTFYAKGNHIPAYCSAMGKSILAFLPEEELATYLKQTLLVPFTQNTICTEEKLHIELEHIRKQGYAVSNGEMVTNLIGIAAPIFDVDGPTRYTISTAGISDEPIDAFAERLYQPLLRISHEISQLLQKILLSNNLAAPTENP